MKRIAFAALALLMILVSSLAWAGGWFVPNNHGSNQNGYSQSEGYSITAKLIDDLATRSGPSTTYTGCGSYRMKGQTVTALQRSYDNGGVLWVLVEFQYGGGYRQAWTGAKRLDLSARQLQKLPELDSSFFIGYGTVNRQVSPRFGPGDIYSSYSDRDFRRGDRTAVISEDNGYSLVECYHIDGNILRCWLPSSYIDMD